MREELLEYYERELAYLRQLGGKFAEKYPRVASRLLLEPDRCDDPHVERLLEGFAFMAARVHLRVDDDFPEVTSALLGIVAPHYLRPIPSMTSWSASWIRSRASRPRVRAMPAGTPLATKRTGRRPAMPLPDGLPSRALAVHGGRSANGGSRSGSLIRYECRARLGVLRVQLAVRARRRHSTSLHPRRLAFHLAGETNVVHTLYELLCRNCISILVRNPQQRGGKVVSISADAAARHGL